MNLEMYQDKKHFRNFCSIFIKLAQKMRYRLLNTSCKFHQNPFINKDFFSIRQSIENTMDALTGLTLFSPLRIYSRLEFLALRAKNSSLQILRFAQNSFIDMISYSLMALRASKCFVDCYKNVFH